jgi:hypothetical protein
MLDEEKPGEDVSPDYDRIEIKSKALDFLFTRLAKANRLFVEGNDAGRRGVIEAINGVLEVLRFFPGTTDHRQPLTSLLNALVNLNDGNVLPLLERAAAGPGSRPASHARESDKAMAESTVDWLCETGLGPNEARKMVAQACREAGIKGAKDSQGQEPEITDRTVRGWCEKIAEDVGCHLQAAQTYKRLSQSWATKTQTITQKAIESVGVGAVRRALLEALRRSLGEMRAAEH